MAAERTEVLVYRKGAAPLAFGPSEQVWYEVRALRHSSALLLLVILLPALSSCSWRDDLDGERRTPEGVLETASTVPALGDSASQLVDVYASRPLMTSYRRGALVIDAGSASFIKYIDGGVRRDWARNHSIADDKGVVQSCALVQGLAAELYFSMDEEVGGIQRTGDALQIRFQLMPAIEKQLVSVFLNEQKLGDLRLNKKEWQSLSLEAPASSLKVGENKLRFYFRGTGQLAEQKSAAAFSRFVIGASLSDDLAFVAGPKTVAGTRLPALQVNAESRISLSFLLPSTDATLKLRVAGQGRGSVRIHGQEMEQSVEVWNGTVSADHWKQVSVPLQDYQGQIIRIDLLSTQAMAWASLQVTHKSTDSQPTKVPVPKHIILWSVASLRADRLRDDVGRAFRDFAKRGFSVAEAQASVPAAGGAHASAMTGRLRVRASIPAEHATLAERLQKAGYATALISGNGFVNEAAGYSRGYGHYDNPMRRQHHFGAKTLWRQARRFLGQHKDQRTFVHVVTVEPHVPYRPTEESLLREWSLPAPFAPAKTLSLGEQIAKGRVMSQNERSYIRALYDASVADVATAFSAMLDSLEEIELEGDVAILLSGDHGEELWERGRFGHGDSMYQEALRTPLAIVAPGMSGRKSPRRSSSIDLYPTILDLVGLQPDPQVQGLSLLGDPKLLDARPIVAGTRSGHRSIRWGRYKLIAYAKAPLELYDLEVDPSEQHNRSDDNPMVARALRVALSTAVAFESSWSTARWGQVASPTEAFARDQGM